ncbi:YgiT-type zinc finger protein [Nocardia nova]|uniref:YgiT-type zinc finger protein n=1 Tax=Nocardia nova TaxID=37330 RepID=UPI0011B01E65
MPRHPPPPSLSSPPPSPGPAPRTISAGVRSGGATGGATRFSLDPGHHIRHVRDGPALTCERCGSDPEPRKQQTATACPTNSTPLCRSIIRKPNQQRGVERRHRSV